MIRLLISYSKSLLFISLTAGLARLLVCKFSALFKSNDG